MTTDMREVITVSGPGTDDVDIHVALNSIGIELTMQSPDDGTEVGSILSITEVERLIAKLSVKVAQARMAA